MELDLYIEYLNSAMQKAKALQDLIGKNVSVCTSYGNGFDLSVWVLRDDDYANTIYDKHLNNIGDVCDELESMVAGAKLAKNMEV